MQFVVEIPDRCVTMDTCFTEWIQNAGKDFRFNILPKGHGRLIDADDIDNHIIGHVDTRSCPTIVKADGGAE